MSKSKRKFLRALREVQGLAQGYAYPQREQAIARLETVTLSGVKAGQRLLARTFQPPLIGLLSVTARVTKGSAAASLQISRDGGTTWGNIETAATGSLLAGEERTFAVAVADGQGVQVGVDTDTSLDVLVVLYWPARLPQGGGEGQGATIPGTGVVATPASGLQTVAITTATTTTVKTSAGVAGTISNAGTAVTGTITVYDSLTGSGTKVWSGTVAVGGVVILGLPCATGITVVTAAADTLAVSYA